MTEELRRRMANKSEAYWDGYDSVNKHRMQNPHTFNSPDEAERKRHDDWEQGWLTRFYGEVPF